MAVRTPLAMLKQALAWHRVVRQEHDLLVPETMLIRLGGRMPTKKQSKSDKIVEKNMREVFDNPPSTLKPGKSAEATRKQQVAIGLSKARAAGADIPEKPKGKKSSRASY